MEQDDSSFFSPNDDFPVVAGDAGYVGRSQQDILDRTPASASETMGRRETLSLKDELMTLENSQSDSALDVYHTHKDKLGSVSERIYYLKLPLHERRDYLESRGISRTNEVATVQEKYFGIRPTTIGMGMSKDEVIESFGKPVRVEVAGNPTYENERWLYNLNGATKYIYFESGRVGGWE